MVTPDPHPDVPPRPWPPQPLPPTSSLRGRLGFPTLPDCALHSAPSAEEVRTSLARPGGARAVRRSPAGLAQEQNLPWRCFFVFPLLQGALGDAASACARACVVFVHGARLFWVSLRVPLPRLSLSLCLSAHSVQHVVSPYFPLDLCTCCVRCPEHALRLHPLLLKLTRSGGVRFKATCHFFREAFHNPCLWSAPATPSLIPEPTVNSVCQGAVHEVPGGDSGMSCKAVRWLAFISEYTVFFK